MARARQTNTGYAGVYSLKGKFGARISHKNRTLHLGTFTDVIKAAETFDLACALLGKPVSSYNFPDADLSYNAMLKLAIHLRSIDAIGMQELEAIKNRYRLLKSAINTLEVVHKQEADNG